jgi:hypothetical protein
MPVVDVDTIATKDKSELVDETLASCLYTEYALDLETVVGDCASMIDLGECQDPLESDSICLNDPVVV